MPGPTTELLNDDLKLVRSDLKDLTKDAQRIEVGLARVETEFGFAKWLLGLLLVATITGIGSGIWWASAITSKLGTLETRFDRIESRFDRLESRIDGLEKSNAVGFDRLETAIAKILEQTKSKP